MSDARRAQPPNFTTRVLQPLVQITFFMPSQGLSSASKAGVEHSCFQHDIAAVSAVAAPRTAACRDAFWRVAEIELVRVLWKPSWGRNFKFGKHRATHNSHALRRRRRQKLMISLQPA